MSSLSTAYRSSSIGKSCMAFALFVLFGGVSSAVANPAYNMTDFESHPIVITEVTAAPKVMINTSNDHQLFFKAYNDYADLDGDGVPETTYTHSIDYYGYFDSYKCYVYDTTAQRFEPDEVTADKYCNGGASSGQWSGNFLNWAAMSRIDSIRKILFGGHRRVDTSSETVLERAYLPHDAHSWAKHYSGSDLNLLAPFISGVDYNCDEGDLVGGAVPAQCSDGMGGVDYRKVGITLGNTTDVDMSLYKNKYSEDYNEPPLIKAVKGNHSLWASNERWQVTWRSGAPYDNHAATNANDPSSSKIFAYSQNPTFAEGIGEKNYVARVLACVNRLDSNGLSLVGTEKCKMYPGADQTKGTANDHITVIDAATAADDILKPIGLLQVYGDKDEMEFGMVAGSYNKHASGGVLIRNIGKLSDEINVDTDGVFNKVASYAGGPEDNNQSSGLINAWSLYRIIGYDGEEGTYNSAQGDNCTWGLSKFADVTSGNRCRNWGNPFAEIYYQSINYLAGGGVIGDYRSNSSTGIPGLPVPQAFKDPLTEDDRCSTLSVINLNSSVISYDYDELDAQNYGPHRIWDPAVLPGNATSRDMTQVVGQGEGLHNRNFFVGELNVGQGTDDQMCTEKTVTNLGDIGGVCPEAPRLLGSYRIAGLAYYAHVEDIRPDDATGGRALEGDQLVDTYAVVLAANVPALEIPSPQDPNINLATIIPTCRNTSLDPEGNCAIVDYKIVEQEVDLAGNTISGSIYVNWEDSEQGGDYDQDMWGILSYHVDLAANTISLTTKVHAKSTPYKMGFGYVLSGSNNDGVHFHSGINGFVYTDTADIGDGCNLAGGCVDGDPPSTKIYTLGNSSAELLKDPLWYAAKWGGFVDANDNKLPDLVSEWDSKINATGETGSDGIPDNYFYANNPRELENSLNQVLSGILERTSSGTAAAVVSSNVRGEGALYQAYYRPKINDDANNQNVNWVGTLQAMWLDKFGLSRQDCSPPRGYDSNSDSCIPAVGPCIPNGQLDNYCVDQVVETYFDDSEGRTRIRVYESGRPDVFDAYSMEGVVKSYSSGNVVMVPNSMEGNFSFDPVSNNVTISPYTVEGEITAYDPLTGNLTLDIVDGGWNGPDAKTFDQWQFTTSTAAGEGFSLNPISLTAGSQTITVSPIGAWLNVGDILSLTTHNVVGKTGKVFSDWHVQCLAGSSEKADIQGMSIQLQNYKEVSFAIDPLVNDFSGCIHAVLYTYNMRGPQGNSYSNWDVSNLDTILGRGQSNSTLMLKNYGEMSFSVSPDSAWLEKGHQVLVANYTSVAIELHDLGTIWNAREELYLEGVTDAKLAVNRDYSTELSSEGRYIKTWVDSNLDGIVDAAEYRDFEAAMFSDDTNPVPYGFLDVDSKGDAEQVIDYIRGIEVPGSRNRTIKFDPKDASAQVMRLGDIVNSTPTVVAAPQEAFDLLYNDQTYAEFRRLYMNRRTVVYAGGNDGLLHAFNGGFYTVADDGGYTLNEYDQVLSSLCTVVGNKEDFGGDGFKPISIKYSTCGYDPVTKVPALHHPLGGEIWAYAPMNLLPHLQWLHDPAYQYSHVYFVDAKPRVFDAKIFQPDADHPNGWGTVLVVGMNLGGGTMEVDTLSDDTPGGGNTGDNLHLRSSYVVLDITNPEKAPVLLGEIPMPDESFTTVYPAVVTFKDVGTNTRCNGNTTACNRWYLQFGTGPNDLNNYTSDQTAKMYLFDLEQFVSGARSPLVAPLGCSLDKTSIAKGTYNLIMCDTGVSNSFMGTPLVVDWDLDFLADTTYFGLVENGTAVNPNVGLMRMSFENQEDPELWNDLHSLYNTGHSITAQPSAGIDDKNNRWVYFGTGRYFSSYDRTTTAVQSLYGIKDDQTDTRVLPEEILDTTDAEIFADGDLDVPIFGVTGITELNTFDEIIDEIDYLAQGWKVDLPAIIGITGISPATRSVTKSALFGGVLFSTVFQPSDDPCQGEGQSRLYGLFYKSGTAYPSPSVFGASIVTRDGKVEYVSRKYLELGRGFGSPPAIHSGSGSGGETVKVFTQLSTGDIVEFEADPPINVRSGRMSWSEN